MPITLGCPSCGKRFRARDESAGKRVKCPFCQAAVAVPTSEEAASANAPTDTVPPLGSGVAGRPAAVAAAPASEWGTSEPAQPLLLEVDQSPPKERERPWPHRPPPTDDPTYAPPARGEKGRGKKPRPADAEGVP